MADLFEPDVELRWRGKETKVKTVSLPALLGAGVQPDRLLVNGPCFVEGAEAIAPEFKRRMFNGQI